MHIGKTNGVILLCQDSHSIQLSEHEVQSMSTMDIKALRDFLHLRRISVKSPTNDDLRAIETHVSEIPQAVLDFLAEDDDDGVSIEPVG